MNAVAHGLLVGGLLIVAASGCSSDCDQQPPPCADASFYSFDVPSEPERPVGPATVESNGPDSIGFIMDETGERTRFRLPVQPALEPGDAVTIEGAGHSYLVSRDGEPSFYTGSGPMVLGPRVETVAGIDLELTAFCREPPVDDQCFQGTTVYALEVGDTRIEPGAIREVELPDGRRATVHNRRVNRGTPSCPDCLDLPPSTFLVDIVFEG